MRSREHDNRTFFLNAMIFDGRGEPGFEGFIVVHGDTIVEVGTMSDIDSSSHIPDWMDTEEVVDCRGLALSSGFIDMHSHSDLQLLTVPDHVAKLSQGVTLEVLGQDGLSYAPVNDNTLDTLKNQLSGWNDNPTGFDWSWRTVGEYLDRLSKGVAVNVAYLVPHGTLRLMVMGNADREATHEDLRQMGILLRSSLDEGALGMSAGLTYVPGMFASTAELVYLCTIVAEYGGMFAPHHRNYGRDVLAAYSECFEIARRSGARLHLAHAHLSFEVNAGKLGDLLEIFDAAEQDGVDFSFDSYPYLAGMTTLMSQLPSWVQTGSEDSQLSRLKDRETRARIIRSLNVEGSDGHQGLTVDWNTVWVAGVPHAANFEWILGHSMSEAAKSRGLDPAELCLDVLHATRLGAPCVVFMGHEDHVRRLMQHPAHTVGSDGILTGTKPHPRSWGTFTRMLETYVRDEGVLTLTECIRHMTTSAADRLGLRDRGRIAPGAKADIVVFDPHEVSSPASYENPRQQSQGITHVMVNGVMALEHGVVTGTRTGRVLGERYERRLSRN